MKSEQEQDYMTRVEQILKLGARMEEPIRLEGILVISVLV